MEKNKKWHIFEDMTAKCYKALDNGNIINECWYSAYDTLLEIIEEEQKKYPGGFGELAEIDERTEYKYNVQGWVDTDPGKHEERLYKDAGCYYSPIINPFPVTCTL